MGRRVSNLAGRQGGAISRAQLRGLAVSDPTIDRLLAAGWLAIAHRGVFRLGRLTQTGVLHAAVPALGERAVVSHRSAAHEHRLLRTHPPATVDVTVPTTRRARGDIRPHRSRLDPRDVTTRGGLPITTVARTLLDIAPNLGEPRLQAAVEEARVQRRLHLPAVEATMRAPSRATTTSGRPNSPPTSGRCGERRR